MDHSKHGEDEKQSFKVGLSVFGEVDDTSYKIKDNLLTVQNGFEFRNFGFTKILHKPKPQNWFNALVSKIIDDDNKPLIQSCVFSYGISSADKNTMIVGNDKEEGVVHHVVRRLFDRLSAKSRKSVIIKCFELYREKINDVFDLKKKVVLREIKGNLIVQNLTEIEITNVQEVN